jgi:hypothetical protein
MTVEEIRAKYDEAQATEAAMRVDLRTRVMPDAERESLARKADFQKALAENLWRALNWEGQYNHREKQLIPPAVLEVERELAAAGDIEALDYLLVGPVGASTGRGIKGMRLDQAAPPRGLIIALAKHGLMLSDLPLSLEHAREQLAQRRARVDEQLASLGIEVSS